MLRLTTFGGIGISRDDVSISGVAEGWRRRALLALIAAAPPAGVSRDLLMRQLWPDSKPDDARHSLDQLLYTIRRGLGTNPFMANESLRFDDAVISTDVAEFRAAVRQRQFERVVALYLGAFADGLEVDASDEAQHRIAAARVQFANDRAAALEALARAACQRLDWPGAIRWWQQLVESDPLNGRTAGEYIAALVAGGERARALKYALVHSTLVAQETGARPEPAIVSWIDRLRSNAPGAENASRAAIPSLAEAEDDAGQRTGRLTRLLAPRYRLGPLLAESNVSADYSARPVSDGRAEVLVRLIQPRLVLVASVPRFREVLEGVVRLAHPCIHAIVDYGAAEDLFYVVTAPRGPRTLRDRLRSEHALPLSDALAIARDIATGLSVAHAGGVRHSDLRPKHIDLSAGGTAIVAGLGLAEAIMPSGSDNGTSTIVTIGSPAYLSPEQLLRQVPADGRSDVYAVGSILYEMLTGDPPFGRTPRSEDVAAKLSGGHPPVRERRDAVSQELAQIVDRCLARVPADRFASATELAEALCGIA